MLECIESIERYSSSRDVELDELTQAKLCSSASELVPGQPWKEMRALENRLRREYDAIREDRIWDIVLCGFVLHIAT
jgi:hypothetical protein